MIFTYVCKRLLTLAVFLVIGQQAYLQQTVESFMFGHSLMDHASATEQTEIAYWIADLANAAGHTYETGGMYGGIAQFADFNPVAQWAVAGVTADRKSVV